ncbi:MAG: hypothetical protein ABIG66_00625 [Candidatus Kerfeldbacteria bacterium]
MKLRIQTVSVFGAAVLLVAFFVAPWQANASAEQSDVRLDRLLKTDPVLSELYVGDGSAADLDAQSFTAQDATYGWTRTGEYGLSDPGNTIFYPCATPFKGKWFVAAGAAGGVASFFYTTDYENFTDVFPAVPRNDAYTMCPVRYKGKMYFSTYNSTDGARLMGSSNGTDWDQVGDFGLGDGPAVRFIDLLMEKDGYLYMVANEATGGDRIVRYDGSTFQQVAAAGFGSASNYQIISLVEFKNRLYASTYNWTAGTELWRSNLNGTNWERIADDGFGEPKNLLSILQEFNGALYVATWTDGTVGTTLLRSTNGTDWNVVTSTGFGDTENDLGRMAAFENDGYFLFGTSNDTTGYNVWRCSKKSKCDEESDFTPVVVGGMGDVTQDRHKLYERNDVAYLIADDSTHQRLYRSTDGTHWTAWTSVAFGDVNNEEIRPQFVDKYLVAGVENSAAGGEIWVTEAAPAQVSDLSLINRSNDSAKLEFTSPSGSDRNQHVVKCYAAGGLDQDNWNDARTRAAMTAKKAGKRVVITAIGLKPNTQYRCAVKTTNAVTGEASYISNRIEFTTRRVRYAVGKGYGDKPQVRIFRKKGKIMVRQFNGLHKDVTTGVHTAAGDVDNNGRGQIVVGSRNGSTSKIRIFSARGTLLAEKNLGMYGTSGVDVAVGNIDGKGRNEIVTCRYSQGNPTVGVYRLTKSNKIKFIRKFNAYLTDNGCTVTTGDTNGNGKESIIVGAGIGAQPNVYVYSGRGEFKYSFTAIPSSNVQGVDVAAHDLTGNGKANIAVSNLAGDTVQVRVYKPMGTEMIGFSEPFGEEMNGGARIDAGVVNDKGKTGVLVLPNEGGQVRVIKKDGSIYTGIQFNPFGSGWTGGGTPSAFAY